MILDKQLQLSDSQALTASADSTNYIANGVDSDLGTGEPMVVMINVEVAANAADGNETYVANLEVDDNTSFSSGTVAASVTIPRGSAAGSKFFIHIPKSQATEEYMQLQYVLGGTTPSVTLSAHIVPQSFVDSYREYASGYTVS
jgi:hypothetical protein